MGKCPDIIPGNFSISGTELKIAFYVADFAIEFVTGRLLYLLAHSRMTYSAMKMKNCYIVIFF
jgi:hypothetical protein